MRLMDNNDNYERRHSSFALLLRVGVPQLQLWEALDMDIHAEPMRRGRRDDNNNINNNNQIVIKSIHQYINGHLLVTQQ